MDKKLEKFMSVIYNVYAGSEGFWNLEIRFNSNNCSLPLNLEVWREGNFLGDAQWDGNIIKNMPYLEISTKPCIYSTDPDNQESVIMKLSAMINNLKIMDSNVNVNNEMDFKTQLTSKQKFFYKKILDKFKYYEQKEYEFLKTIEEDMDDKKDPLLFVLKGLINTRKAINKNMFESFEEIYDAE